MTQALYAHMNNKRKKKKEEIATKILRQKGDKAFLGHLVPTFL
jgi:hypothetical protein